MKNINKELKKDRKEILKYIIETYVETSYPISSEHLVTKYNLKMSSAKVRYIMNELEQLGLLKKTHVSSGRVPSSKGYSFYAKFIATHDTDTLKNEMKDIFYKRWNNIDITLDEAAKQISDIAGVTLITSISNDEESLKHIQLVPLDDNKATIILVTSYGQVFSKTITLEKELINSEDLKVAVRVFKERLVGVPIIHLAENAYGLMPLLSKGIKNYETILQNFIQNVFNFEMVEENKVYGEDKIILASKIKREDIITILKLIKNNSIWSMIEKEFEDEDETIKIAIHNNNSAFISKKINSKKIKEISVVGASNMDYNKSFAAIQALEDLIKEQKDQ
ncbi:heat-inducible transcriptional repressor HrcA [Mycoplasmopsis columbinasalis]|uniref:Heat-inducible transcription repressor HrcA n=1 Tax=Mycoplasmopsis columbinasalis TaxID=114880 RepID=A0A449BA51_9BACT|nr:heat-inducible transcriptional repressor HrcA [Mycoplasmopsis columbinasalis]VEU78054.1 heat inducible transcription repressor HrcA [Mycoplasmopsis columbinasalis]